MALADEGINERLLEEANRVKKFIPYYYIPETMKPIPDGKGFYGGKWHWMRGIQDCSSNYQALEDPKLGEFIEASEKIDLPIVFEEELAFTEAFVRKTKNLKIIIPHLGMLEEIQSTSSIPSRRGRMSILIQPWPAQTR